jgi:glucose/arabinose dehydrogenase
MTNLAAIALTLILASQPAPQMEDGDYQLTELGATFSSPLYLTAPDCDSRLFVVERSGRILVVKQGVKVGTPFLDVSTLLPTSPGGEQGLLGLAFHPNYAANGRFFVTYTDARGTLVVAEYHANPSSDVADASQVKKIISIPQPSSNHNGGMLLFGPDDNLYLGVGDGGGSGDPGNNGQNNTTLLGTILRVDVAADGFPADPARNYAIPVGNPFAGGPGADEIWYYGLRNPWRFWIDAETGNFYVADVGQGQREEVTVLQPGSQGANLGWNRLEGTRCYPSGGSCSTAGTVLPQVEYTHSEGRSITGGPVYRGTAMPELEGTYFYGDFSSGWFRSFVFNGTVTDHYDWTKKLGGTSLISSFGADSEGNVYVVSLGGSIWRLDGRSSEGLFDDFSGDGKTDILLRRAGNLFVATTGASSAGPFNEWTQASHGIGWTAIHSGDFTGDGAADVAEFHPSNGSWWVSQSDGNGFIARKWADFATNSGWGPQVVGDFTGDNRDDIANYYPGNGTWWVSRSTGGAFSTASWADFTTRSGWQARLVGDFDGDGRDDIGQFHPGNGTWWISLSTGSGFVTSLWADFTTSSGWTSRVVGDFNGDNKDDIAQFHPGNGTWWISLSTGSGFVTSLWADFTTSSGWSSQIAGDFNADGRDDIANFHPGNGTWWVSRSTGSGLATSLWADYTTPSGWTRQVAADFNDDGRDDIANYHDATGTFWVSQSTGSSFATSKWAE